MDFFEVNLMDRAPDYLVSAALKKAYEDAVSSIKMRSAVLNEALVLSGMEANKFHLVAKQLFDMNQASFDRMDAMTLALICKTMDDGLPTLHRIEWPNAVTLFDTAFTTTREWESLRHIGIGGSDSGTVMGCSPYTTLRQLFHSKVGTPMAVPEPDNNPAFERGHITEPKVIQAFCTLTGAERVPESRMFASRDFPNSTANIDAIVRMPGGALYVFEAKTTKDGNQKAWLDDRVPPNYLTQTHQYPAVLNDDRIRGTYISCMFVMDYTVDDMFLAATFDELRNITHLVERDTDYELTLLEAERDFWNEYIVPGIEPEPGEPALEMDFLAALNGPADSSSPIVTLPVQTLPDLEQWLELDTKRKTLEGQAATIKDAQDSIKVRLVEMLGTAVEGRLNISDSEYYEVRFSQARDKCKLDTKIMEQAFPQAYERYGTYAALKDEFPDAYDACMKTAPGARTFSLKKKSVSGRKKKK